MRSCSPEGQSYPGLLKKKQDQQVEQTDFPPLLCSHESLQVSQRSSECPIPGIVQGQVGCGFEQPGLVKDVPAYGRGVGLSYI